MPIEFRIEQHLPQAFTVVEQQDTSSRVFGKTRPPTRAEMKIVLQYEERGHRFDLALTLTGKWLEKTVARVLKTFVNQHNHKHPHFHHRHV